MRDRISTLLIATVAAAALVSACEQRPSGQIGQQMSSGASKLADKAADATTNIATAADDTMITMKVKEAIFADPALKSADISVETNGGTVTLSGSVASADLRDKAKQVASTTPGVRGVVDSLTVKAATTS